MIDRLTRNQLVRLSVDERLSPEFRKACRRELGDQPEAEPWWYTTWGGGTL